MPDQIITIELKIGGKNAEIVGRFPPFCYVVRVVVCNGTFVVIIPLDKLEEDRAEESIFLGVSHQIPSWWL